MLQIDKFSLKKPSTLATTYMNISAILSNMSKYLESYKLAKKANSMFLQIKEEHVSKYENYSTGNPEDSYPVDDIEQSVKVNFIISYFNMAIAAECNGNKKLALEHACQGYHFAVVDVGVDHALTLNMKQYVDKLSDDFAQNQMHRLPPKAKRDEPSGRNNDTSYFSGKMSQGGLDDFTGGTTKRSQIRSMRDRSMYNHDGRLEFRKKEALL